MVRLLSSRILIVVIFFYLFTPLAKASVLYIDPGAGSLLFQILSAIVLAILFYLSLIRKTLVKLFNKVKKVFSNQKVDT
ncbi:MAG: hypothetical protein FJ213_12890 [Ignavibacteria bacterium]|nr:hypothetical protein [Ignavibacteria bacterium]